MVKNNLRKEKIAERVPRNCTLKNTIDFGLQKMDFVHFKEDANFYIMKIFFIESSLFYDFKITKQFSAKHRFLTIFCFYDYSLHIVCFV